jgi:hypothetical protein
MHPASHYPHHYPYRYHSQPRSSLLCLVTSSNGGSSSASGLMFSQADGHLTPNSYSSAFSWLTRNQKVRVKVMLRLTASQSVCLGVHSALELVTRYYFASESCCVVSVGRPLWRDVKSISVSHCQQCLVHRQNLIKFTFYMTHVWCIYSINKASVSPDSVQQITSHHL